MDKPKTVRDMIKDLEALPEEAKDLPLYMEIDTDRDNFYTAYGEVKLGMFINPHGDDWRFGHAFSEEDDKEDWEDDENDQEYGPWKTNAVLIC